MISINKIFYTNHHGNLKRNENLLIFKNKKKVYKYVKPNLVFFFFLLTSYFIFFILFSHFFFNNFFLLLYIFINKIDE